MPVATPRTRRTRRSARSGPVTPRSVLVAYDPSKISYEQLLKTFWEAHDPTQGMRQGNDVGTSYRSIIIVADDEQRATAEASKAMYQAELSKAGYGDDHDRDRRCRDVPVLLRRGLPPAVPRQESRAATARTTRPA